MKAKKLEELEELKEGTKLYATHDNPHIHISLENSPYIVTRTSTGGLAITTDNGKLLEVAKGKAYDLITDTGMSYKELCNLKENDLIIPTEIQVLYMPNALCRIPYRIVKGEYGLSILSDEFNKICIDIGTYFAYNIYPPK
jgi:hypothetical protein